MTKSSGLNGYPPEVEDLLGQHGAVAEGYVIYVPNRSPAAS
jgi:acyl-CoA synthetase (AMP-forming)/AMP-acid ligase II